MSEQQLERSVLESKEREELHAIASALGTKPTSRAKKADLVSQILRATGVEAGGRGGKTAGADQSGHGPSGSRTAGAKADDAGAGTQAAGSDGDEGAAADRPRRTRARKQAASTADANGSDADATSPEASTSPPGRAADPSGSGQERPEVHQAEPTAPGPARGDANGAEPPRGSASTPANGRASDTPQPSAAGTPTANGNANATANANAGTAPGEGRAREHGGDRGSRFEGEPGNRRNRRRRGRDRSDRAERDLPGQGGGDPSTQFSGEPVEVKGFLDLRDDGYGFLRTEGFLASQSDIYVSISQVRRFALRKGDWIEGASRPASNNEKYPALLRIDTVSGLTPDEARERSRFDRLTPLFPDEKLRLEVPGDPANVTARIVDLIAPIGKGQRGLIVSPPKAGKTTVLKQVAHSIEANHPEVHLMVLLVDERPEEVTDMRRSVNGEVIASTFDRPAEEHTQVAELAIERARRLVEVGRDVVIVLDGITRLARAYNLAQPTSGRIMSGGIDTGALYPPKKFFGAARNVEEGGSLTILATALVETGGRMDEVIFEEFKGTGNMELRLDRKIAERRIYPAIDVNASSTRHEELLFDRTQLQQVWKLRRVLNALAGDGGNGAGLELLMERIRTTPSNDEFLAEIAKTPAPNV